MAEDIIIWIIVTLLVALILWILKFFSDKTWLTKKVKWVFKKSWNKDDYILFIDDNINGFALIESLTKQWYNIDTLKDITDIECAKISRAKIIFVDHRWVWKGIWEKSWLWVIRILKKRYNDEKKLVLFSATRFWIDQIDELDIADEKIKKNSSPEAFVKLIEKLS